MDIVVSQHYRKTTSRVWQAITKLEEMKQWFFENIPDFKPQVGFKIRFSVSTPNHDFIHEWEILEVVPEEKISYSWCYEGFKGYSTVTFSLAEKNNGCELTVQCKGIESFPQNMEEFKPQSCRQGWEYFIQEQLTNYLNKAK